LNRSLTFDLYSVTEQTLERGQGSVTVLQRTGKHVVRHVS